MGSDRQFYYFCRYLNAIQTNSQHLLRYLAAAVIVNKRRRNVMKDLVKIIEQESYEYRDPITGQTTVFAAFRILYAKTSSKIELCQEAYKSQCLATIPWQKVGMI